jgi:hypothetical protein
MPKKPDKLFEAFAREQQRNSNNNKEEMRSLPSFFITREQLKNKNKTGRNENLALQENNTRRSESNVRVTRASNESLKGVCKCKCLCGSISFK